MFFLLPRPLHRSPATTTPTHVSLLFLLLYNDSVLWPVAVNRGMWEEVGESAQHELQCWSHSRDLWTPQNASHVKHCVGGRLSYQPCVSRIPYLLSDHYLLQIRASNSHAFLFSEYLPPPSCLLSSFWCFLEVAMPLPLLLWEWKH